MLKRHPALKKALSLLLSFALVLPTSLALVGDSGTAEAKATLPYIEELKAQQGGAFNILEVVPTTDSDYAIGTGTFGYYIAGYEPCRNFAAVAAAQTGNYTTNADGSVTGNSTNRVNYVNNTIFKGLQSAGILSSVSESSADTAKAYPLTLNAQYSEKYPWEITTDNSAQFPNTLNLKKSDGASYYDAVTGVKATFTAKPANETNVTDYAYTDATKYTLSATSGTFVQDVAYYTANADEIAQLTTLGETPYYYSLSFQKLTVDESGKATLGSAEPASGAAVYVSSTDYNGGAGTPDADSFVYLGKYKNSADNNTVADSITLDQAHTYYVLDKASAPKAAADTANKDTFTGASHYVYAAITQNNGFRSAASGETGYFTPDSSGQTYRYVGAGYGTYKCELKQNASAVTILTPIVYYNSCYTNNEWFKRYVLDCDVDSTGKISETLKLNIKVTTKKPADITTDDIIGASLIDLSYGMQLDASGKNTLTDTSYNTDLTGAVVSKITDLTNRKNGGSVRPIIIDKRLSGVSTTTSPNLRNYAASIVNYSDEHNVNVLENFYLFDKGQIDSNANNFATKCFCTALNAVAARYTEVANKIRDFNTVHSAQGSSDTLDTTVSMAAVIRHIINASAPTVTKGYVRVLDIEPGRAYGGGSNLVSGTVQDKWLAGTALQAYTPQITTWSTAELIGKIDEIAEEFDIVYVGTDTTGYYTSTNTNDLNQAYIDTGDNDLDGLVYANIGDVVRSGSGTRGYSLSGLLDRDFTDSNTSDSSNMINAMSGSLANQFRFSGNDITGTTLKMLENFADAGHPVVLADDLRNSLSQTTAPSETGQYFIRLTWTGPLTGKKYTIDLPKHDYNYAITANKGKLTVNPATDNMFEAALSQFDNRDDDGSGMLSQLKSSINNPTCTWYYTKKGEVTPIPNYSGNTLQTASYPSGTSFYCKVTVNRFNLSWWTCEPLAKTQTAALTKSAVNTKRVDNCSKMYDFLYYLNGKTNAFSEGQFSLPYDGADATNATANRTSLAALVNVSNPAIVWTDKTNAKTYPTDYALNNDTMTTLTADASGKYYLNYSFKITNPTDPTPASTTYTCNLYVDSNGDGRFSDDEKLENVEVDCDDRMVPAGRLRATEAGGVTYTYTIQRPLTDEISGVIPWKLELVKTGDDGVHCSETGFTHITGTGAATGNHAAKSIKVLQVTPNNGTNIDLKSDAYKTLFDKVNKDYSVTVEQVAVNTLTSDSTTIFNELNKYDMLVLGFAGSYAEIGKNAALAIQQYIGTGKAVLFTHDTGSYYSLPNGYKEKYAEKTTEQVVVGRHWVGGFFGHYVYDYKTVDVFSEDAVYDGTPTEYYFNTLLRDVAGQDRYGVTSSKTVSADGSTVKIGQTSKVTGSGVTASGITATGASTSLSMAQVKALQQSDYSVAFKPNSALRDANGNMTSATTLPETQGLTNNLLMRFYTSGTMPYGYYKTDSSDWWNNIVNNLKSQQATRNKLQTTNTVTQVNKGQITTYPFDVNTDAFKTTRYAASGADNNKMAVSETHMQYDQLNMNPADIVVWYCLGGGSSKYPLADLFLPDSYDYMTNDVVNQYYIYSCGNITYTGAGHSSTQTADEQKMIVNTIIAAYRHTQSAPVAAFTDSEGAKTSVKAILVPSDNNTALSGSSTTDENRRIYFKLQSTSFGAANLTKTYSVTLGCTIDGSAVNSFNLSSVHYIDSAGTVHTVSCDKALDTNTVYYVTLDDLFSANSAIQTAVTAGNAVKFLVTPSMTTTLTTTGTSNTYAGTATEIPLQKMQLFDLG